MQDAPINKASEDAPEQAKKPDAWEHIHTPVNRVLADLERVMKERS